MLKMLAWSVTDTPFSITTSGSDMTVEDVVLVNQVSQEAQREYQLALPQ